MKISTLRQKREERIVMRSSNFAHFDPASYKELLELLHTKSYFLLESDLVVHDKANGIFTLVKLEKESARMMHEEYLTTGLVSACKLRIKENRPIGNEGFSAYGKSLYTLTNSIVIYRTLSNSRPDCLLSCAQSLIQNRCVKQAFYEQDVNFITIIFDKIMDYSTYHLLYPNAEEVEKCIAFCLRELDNMQNARILSECVKGALEGDLLCLLNFILHHSTCKEVRVNLYRKFCFRLRRDEGFMLHCYNKDFRKAWQCAVALWEHMATYNPEYNFEFASLGASERYRVLKELKELVRSMV